MICPSCGTPVPDKGKFCLVCGAALLHAQQSAPAAYPPQGIPVPYPPQNTPVAYPLQGAFVPAPYPQQGVPAFAAYPPKSAPTIPPRQQKKLLKGLFIGLAAAVLVILVGAGIVIGLAINRSINYDKAVSLFDSGEYQQAYEAFGQFGDYRDSLDYQDQCKRYLDDLAAVQDITDFMNGQFDKLRNYNSSFWRVEMADSVTALNEVGIDVQELVEAWMGNSSCEVVSVQVNNNRATAELKVT